LPFQNQQKFLYFFIFIVLNIAWLAGSFLLFSFPPQHAVYFYIYHSVFVAAEILFIYAAFTHFCKMLQASENMLKNLFENNPNPMWLYNKITYKFVKVNQAAVQQYGYSEDEFLAMTAFDLRPFEEIEKLKKYFEYNVDLAFDAGIWRHKKKDGSILFVKVLTHSLYYHNQPCRLVIPNDVTPFIEVQTQLKETQKQLQHSLMQYTMLAKATKDAMWDWNFSTGFISWNEGLQSSFGYSLKESTLAWWYENIHPDDYERVYQKLENCFHTHETLWSDEYRFRCSNQAYKYVLDRGVVIYDENNQPFRMIGVMQDIQERIEQQKEIVQLSLVAQKTNNLVLIVDKHYKIKWVNQAFIKHTGYSYEEAMNKQIHKLFYGANTNKYTALKIMYAFTHAQSFTGKLLAHKKNGITYWIQFNSTPIFVDKELESFIVVCTDISDIKKQEEISLQQSRQLRELSFMNSHKTRRPLANILGLIEVLNLEPASASDPEILQFLKFSAQELDEMLHTMVAELERIENHSSTLSN
jgi:PAS domain S-box-containing protein